MHSVSSTEIMATRHRLACPSCGSKYLALFFRSRSTCPYCRASVQTALQTVSITETIDNPSEGDLGDFPDG